MNKTFWKMTLMIFMGFSSGLPLLLTGTTLQAWMVDEGLDLKTIGLYSLVGIPYTWKFIWSPLMDRFSLLPIGRRKSWMLFTQISLFASIFYISTFSVGNSITTVALIAVLIAFFSASQDIVLDAYRREILQDHELGLGSSFFISGYRAGMLVSGALALYLADKMPWSTVYIIMSCCMLVGIITTCLCPEPKDGIHIPKSLRDAVVLPLVDYFKRSGALPILFFILCYKLGDVMASTMAMPFYLKMEFTKTEIAGIVKTFGLVAILLGGIVGGSLLLKISLKKCLWGFGILQMVSTAGFALLAIHGKDLWFLTWVIAFENFTAGLGASAFVAFMASLCNKNFSATQYALLSSLVAVPGKIISAGTGYMAESLGWPMFFMVCTLLAIPGLLMLFNFDRWQKAS